MGSEYGKGVNCIRGLFVVCNILFLLLGLLCLGTGIWGVYVSTEGNYEVLTGGNLISAGILFIVSGFITIAIASMGIIGGLGMWRPFLIIYAIAVIIIGVIEIVGAILAFVFTDAIQDEVRENMMDAIKNYRLNESDPDYDEQVNTAVESVQGFFECCGVDNYTDWIENNPYAIDENTGTPPARCFCDVNQENCEAELEIEYVVNNMSRTGPMTNVWDRGCLTLLEDSLDGTAIINGVIGIVVGVVEFTFVAIAIGLCICITRSRRDV